MQEGEITRHGAVRRAALLAKLAWIGMTRGLLEREGVQAWRSTGEQEMAHECGVVRGIAGLIASWLRRHHG